jgi:hypothetical protein
MNCRGVAWGLVLLCLVSAFAYADPGAPAPGAPPLARIFAKDGTVYIAELLEEGKETLKAFDLKSGKELTIAHANVVKLQRDITEDEAIKWAGLAPYLAWRVRLAQSVSPSGQVATVTPTAVYVNLGQRGGIQVGDKLNVYRMGDLLTDPTTGEELGQLQSLIAELEVIEVEEKFSKAKQTSQMETQINRGDTVQLARSRRPVAVLPIAAADLQQAQLAGNVREEWTAILVSRDVPVVERAQLDKVVAELGLQQSALMDPATASEVGRLVGASAVLVGSLGRTPTGSTKVYARLVRVGTGEVLLALSDQVKLSAQPATGSAPPLAVTPQRALAAREGAPRPFADVVEEGIGWRAARLGATREAVRKAFGAPEDAQPFWLNYRKRLGVDVFFASNETAIEIRFNQGFTGRLTTGIGIGSSMNEVFGVYGRPTERKPARSQEGAFEPWVLYQLTTSSKIIYPDKGVLFWFDSNGKVSQFVVISIAAQRDLTKNPDMGGSPDMAPPESPEPPAVRVTLIAPYPESYAGAPRDKLAVEYAVIEIAKQAGLRYNWDESYRNTDPVCRRWVKPHIVNVPCQQALSQILDPVGLTYELRGDEIILKRR